MTGDSRKRPISAILSAPDLLSFHATLTLRPVIRPVRWPLSFLTFASLLVVSWSHAANISLPTSSSEEGFLLRLLVNEVPFPGERAWRSEADSRRGMEAILNVLHARRRIVPAGYRQSELAVVTSDNLFDIITAGGERGQVDGFYRDGHGRLAITPRVEERLRRLEQIANQGSPGRFAALLSHARQLTTAYLMSATTPPEPFQALRSVDGVRVTGHAYSWMTDTGNHHPGGSFVRIPDAQNGAPGGNRFFTLRVRR